MTDDEFFGDKRVEEVGLFAKWAAVLIFAGLCLVGLAALL